MNVACSQSTPLIHYTHCGCDVADVGLQSEGEGGAAQARRRAGDEQEGCLYGLHDGAAELRRHFGACPVEITTANDKLSDHFIVQLSIFLVMSAEF